MKDKSFYRATSIIIGTAIGAGIFALPYAFMKAGYFAGVFYLLFFGLVTVVLLKAYGEVVLRTNERMQIIGYVKKYLGQKAGVVSIISFLFGLTGALIAYTIQVGRFLNILLPGSLGGNGFIYGLFFFGCVAFVILFGLRLVARFEQFLVGFLLLLVSVILVAGAPRVAPENLVTFDATMLFLPYGVVLFALSAASAIPDATRALPDRRHLFKSIHTAMAVPLIVYLLFTLVVVGVSGTATDEGAIPGLADYLGQGIVYLGAFLGTLTMTSAFLCLGLVLKEIYQYDFKLRPFFAWLAALTPPLVVYLFHLGSFVAIISLVGGIMGGFDGILILLMWRKARLAGEREPECQISIPGWFQKVMILIFGIGIIYEIYFNLLR